MTKFISRVLTIAFTLLVCFSFIGSFAFSSNHSFSFSSTVLTDSTDTVQAGSESSSIYDKLDLGIKGLSRNAFDYALAGFEKLKAKGKLSRVNILTIIDFTKPSNQKRLYVIDVSSLKLLFNSYVAHGQNSGKEMAESFSNNNESYQSSIGFYITAGTYAGKNGYSMYLNGVDKGFNDHAYERSIVMHGAEYATENFVQANGYLGRSWGCPAVPPALNKPIIDKIKGGSCLFIYSNKKNYLSKSSYING